MKEEIQPRRYFVLQVKCTLLETDPDQMYVFCRTWSSVLCMEFQEFPAMEEEIQLRMYLVPQVNGLLL
jgi:hypothetical protein